MGPKDNKKFSESVDLGTHKRVSVAAFKGEIYIHFMDKSKNKNVTLTKEEFEILLKKQTKMNKLIKKCGNWIKINTSAVLPDSSSESESDV